MDADLTYASTWQGYVYLAVVLDRFRIGQRCEQAGIRPSMGRTKPCFDNAIIENFRLAGARADLPARLHARSEADRALFDYIEGFYNPCRRIPPVADSAEYERRYARSQHLVDAAA
jgi:transposase InsO family protein